MASGPEHFLEAEWLLHEAQDGYAVDQRAEYTAMAQVHATLALAAATALNDHDPDGSGMSGLDLLAWDKAAGVDGVDTGREGCVDHEPTASASCPDCARAQGVTP